jgi:hypothetical protein
MHDTEISKLHTICRKGNGRIFVAVEGTGLLEGCEKNCTDCVVSDIQNVRQLSFGCLNYC